MTTEQQQLNENRRQLNKKILIITGAILAFLLVVGQCTGDPEEKKVESNETSEPAISQAVASPAAPQVPVPEYSVAKESSARFDGKPTLYVVVAPIDITNDSFKTSVRGVAEDLARQHGPDFSAWIFDDEATADGSFAERSGGPAVDKQENARHLIAIYSGGLSTTIYPYGIDWFPGTFTDDPAVGRWVDGEQWKPDTAASSSVPTEDDGPAWKRIPSGTHEMGGMNGKNWGVWETGGARGDDGCNWSVRMIDPNGPAIVLDEGTAGRGENVRVVVNPIRGEKLVFMTSGCETWKFVD